MQLRKVEIPHNSPEQVRDYIRDALALVDELAPAEDLRAAVFRAAYDGLSGKQLVMEQAPTMPLDAILSNGRRM